MEKTQKKTVVIVGGGIAGAFLAKNLQFDANVVLIDSKEYYEMPWSELRSKVEPKFAEKTLIKHTEYFTHGTLVIARATGITQTEVITDNGREISYDYLVVATGHVGDVPKSRNDRLEQFKQDNKKIESSSSILIIGGGPTGVELAGELATDYPDKKIALVHKGSRLLEFVGPKASKKALKWLQSKKVQVLLNQTVDLNSISEGEKVYNTSAGEKITADSSFVCMGKPLGSAWLKETSLKENLDKNGRLMVDENLRVKGLENTFAIGDITDIPEIKQGALAHNHAKIVAKNINLLMKGGKESGLATYKAGPAIAIVSLGRKNGVAQFPFMTISGRMAGMIKSKDLFVGMTRKAMGVDQ